MVDRRKQYNQSDSSDVLTGNNSMQYDQTPQVHGNGLRGLVTGRNDAVFLRNRYQTELDNTNITIVKSIARLEDASRELKAAYNQAQKLKNDVIKHENERRALYSSLENLLNKETDFEEGMWDKTTKRNKVKTINIRQKINESDVEEMHFDSMMDYLKQYPEYGSKTAFKQTRDKIENKEREIRETGEKYNEAVSEYNHQFSIMEIEVQKTNDNISTYYHLLEDGKKRLSESRYVCGIFHSLASEKAKQEVSLDVLRHRVDRAKNTIGIIKSDLSERRIKLEPMEY
jgi:hypothetical protein